MLPIFYNPCFESDCRNTGNDSAHQKGFSPHSENRSISSPNGEQIAAGLWLKSRVAHFAFLKGNNSLKGEGPCVN